MKNKKIIITIIIVVILSIIVGVTYHVLTKQDEKTTLTILEKQWIEDNKNNIIDLGMVNNIPIFNYDGEGILFDFINEIEKDTGLEFNKISYEINTESNTDYSFMLTDTVEKNDILIYQDNYVIVTKEKVKYSKLDSIKDLVIGVEKNTVDKVSTYLGENKNISFKSYESYNDMLKAMQSDTNEINAIVVPKTLYLEEIEKNDFYIAYHISEMSNNLVLRLGNDKKLNTIVKKYYKKWYNEKYDDLFNEYLSDIYFNVNEIYEESIANFRSKRYQYGFINNAPYDYLADGKLVGINNEIMKKFAKAANIEINYTQYKDVKSLINAFNENKIDFFFNLTSTEKYDMDAYNTNSIYSENVVILSSLSNTLKVNSIYSLKGEEVYTISGSKIESYLKKYDVNVKAVNDIEAIFNKMNNNSVIAIDEETYNIYKNEILKEYKIYYTFSLDSDYNFTIRDITDNDIFIKYFDFYLSFNDEEDFISNITYHNFEQKIKKSNIIYIILIAIIIILGFISAILFKKKKKHSNKVTSISKENKLRYIDMLTSLKNRTYLNDNIEKWDSSDIYPQAIVIVDLNNIAYINDNYGHEEGDNIIKEAANILISNQVENSEIMRTNGNEFLIYLVEYDEKQVVTYIRKLNKEFKELTHGFGAALGYSMIVDALKTVDDAINEATLDMRSNKEENNN